jgi:hypothetical protein
MRVLLYMSYLFGFPDCLLYYLLYGSSCCWGVCERDVLVLQDFLDLLCFTAA